MSGFLDLFMLVYNFMKNTTILSFSIGDVSVTLTFLNLLIGGAVAILGIEVVQKVFDW